MPWADLLDIMRDEVGREAMLRIERRARAEMGGERITVSRKPPVNGADIEAAAPGKVRDAAEQLNIPVRTAYRRLKARRVR